MNDEDVALLVDAIEKFVRAMIQLVREIGSAGQVNAAREKLANVLSDLSIPVEVENLRDEANDDDGQ